MSVDETALEQKHELVRFSVISSTRISSKTASVIDKLQTASDDGKPNLVILKSKAHTASKLVSVVEIAKRELAKSGHKCFQYNALSSEMVQVKRRAKSAAHSVPESKAHAEQSESDEAFETMAAEPQTGTKERRVPVMITYLCASSVKELKTAHG